MENVWAAPRRIPSSVGYSFSSFMQTTLRRHATYGFWLRRDWRKAKKGRLKTENDHDYVTKRVKEKNLFHYISDMDSDKTTCTKVDNGLACSAARLTNVNVRRMRENIRMFVLVIFLCFSLRNITAKILRIFP